jgi:two-component system chemotaxis response regulator CheY
VLAVGGPRRCQLLTGRSDRTPGIGSAISAKQEHVMKRALTPILVVDDDEPTLAFIRRALETLGITGIDLANDGSEALAKLETQPYGLIISDWHMRSMGGLQLLRHVRSSERLAHIPFMIITGDAQVDIVLTARQSGADAVVLKPFGLDALRTKIGDVVKQRPKYAKPIMPQSDRPLPSPRDFRAHRLGIG